MGQPRLPDFVAPQKRLVALCTIDSRCSHDVKTPSSIFEFWLRHMGTLGEPKTARSLRSMNTMLWHGLHAGDRVRVFNDRGLELPVRISSKVRPVSSSFHGGGGNSITEMAASQIVSPATPSPTGVVALRSTTRWLRCQGSKPQTGVTCAHGGRCDLCLPSDAASAS